MEQEATEHPMPEHVSPEPETSGVAAGVDATKRNDLAIATVKRFSAWSAFGGLVPVPVLDVLAVGGIQLQMLRRLARIYDIPFSENAGKSVVASLMGSIFPASAASSAAMGAGSAIKAVPVLGTAIGTFVMPSLSAGATFIIGKVFMQHFASGGTLLDFNAPDYREFIKTQSANLSSKL
jgi:uncharacterized protein (DUF697 family)